MTDISEISQVILQERQGRDRGWFEQEADLFHPDSRVTLSWFDGTGPEFVRRSRAMFDAGVRPIHRMGPPVVHLDRDRAIAEVPAEMSSENDFGVAAHVVGYVRLLYRLERRDERWRISAFDAIYERDMLVPSLSGTSPRVDADVLATYRSSYRHLAYQLVQQGHNVPDDLYGDDRPDAVDRLYDEAFGWMRGG